MAHRLSAFVAYRHTGEDPAWREELVTAVCRALEARGIEIYCTLFAEEEFQGKSLGPREILLHAFAEIERRDFLFVVQASSEKSEGMIAEVGGCLRVGQPFVVAWRSDVTGTYLPELAGGADFVWNDLDDLVRQIAEFDFGALVERAWTQT